MNAKQFLGNLTNATDLLQRSPQMLFARRETVDGIPCISFGFTVEPKTHIERFASMMQCDLWWNEFTSIMTEMCKPPCVAMSEVMFQPTYLRRVVCYSDERAHFVILDFGNQRNLWLGHHQKARQTSLYTALAQFLGSDFVATKGKVPPTE